MIHGYQAYVCIETLKTGCLNKIISETNNIYGKFEKKKACP